MGISVSVDSWVQQTIEELSSKSYPAGDKIYRSLVTSASFPSEIFVLESEYFEELVHAKKNNLDNVINVCLENLTANDSVVRLNSAALLLRIFPFLWTEESPVDFEAFMLGQRQLFGRDVSPGVHIVHTALTLLSELPLTDPNELFDEIDGNMPVFDLLGLVVFGMVKHFHNQTLYHQMIVTIQNEASTLMNVLFNYVHVGGRKGSIISLLTLMMFHPGGNFTRVVLDFVSRGGQLSQQLVRTVGDETDVMCMLCAMSISGDDVRVPLNMTDANILRLALVKALMNKKIVNTAAEVVAAFEQSKSPLAQALLMRIESESPGETEHLCSPLHDAVFVDPHDSAEMMEWIPQAVAHLFLFAESFLFIGTGIKQVPPSFEALDSLVIQTT